jgi:hypothetical protein
MLRTQFVPRAQGGHGPESVWPQPGSHSQEHR